MSNLLLSFATFVSTLFAPSSNIPSHQFDLLINGQDDPISIVNIQDFKPGDSRRITKDIYVNAKKDVKLFFHLIAISSYQGQQTEPEILEENGTPKSDFQNYTWYGLSLENTSLIPLSNKIILPHAVSCWIPLGTFSPKKHYKLYQDFTFDPRVTNWAQGDEIKFTEEFYAQEATVSSLPTTSSGRIWNSAQKKCIDLSVTPTKKPKPTCKPNINVNVSGNGAGTSNSVIIDSNCTTVINQSSNTSVDTTVTSVANSGN